ncbi:adenylyltransferase/cytidyltransferase family protein [bacterium]|nr:adenylyltransferase/cytidyltransferase family protein [bacterium]MBU1599926.1 adenylyltransferase/cytidyltransferase family protein [bacterium]
MKKIITRSELKGVVKNLKAQNKKIVFTNGCFDLIHIGHTRLLKMAKEEGDVLIVGLNSDSSVSAIKPNRPIIPENERAEVLSALEMVDYVVIFSEPEPTDIIKEIKPNILVKGGDWKEDEVKGREFSDKVKLFAYIEKWSTSTIITRCKKA